MAFDPLQCVSEKWRERLRWDELPEDIQEQIARYGLEMFGLGQHVTGDISEIKYDGRLIILSDGTRWEVAASDTGVADLWSQFSKVVILDGEMYNIEDAEKVAVQEDD